MTHDFDELVTIVEFHRRHHHAILITNSQYHKTVTLVTLGTVN